MTKKDSKVIPSFQYEREAVKNFDGPVAGVDEAGRGPWAGPVIAAAVILDPENYPDGLNDSKKLSAKIRDQLFDSIMETAVVGVGVANVARIDKMNILHASLWAMSQAIKKLETKPIVALIDGNKSPKTFCETVTIVKGDSHSLSIAAASIIAKVTRDRMMEKLAKKFPHYSWEKNKGYGTSAHIAGIEEHGITVHHRTSFKPVRGYMGVG
ncbi:MAG: ribonuclease HII [Methyloligellaceae bacterium]